MECYLWNMAPYQRHLYYSKGWLQLPQNWIAKKENQEKQEGKLCKAQNQARRKTLEMRFE